MALCVKQLARSSGFIVTVICYGVGYLDCKRDSLQRKKVRFVNDLNMMFCRFVSLKLKAEYEKEQSNLVKQQLEEYNK